MGETTILKVAGCANNIKERRYATGGGKGVMGRFRSRRTS